ncbi:MAG: DUF1829 domain-containing protein [Hyphomicrobiaceae bacterium]|nr:DUF1829 domain-containing protein [Hyphomicrobiaceae bacterium]MCC0010121.1 DUF1829 domain-containing protein [Hyphomicrobiaceae bacterium]
MSSVSEISQLVDGYQKWLKDKTTLKSLHADWVEISTPFLDRHNDYILLYVKAVDGGYHITDDGHTIRDLVLSGCNLDTPKRRSLLQVTLNGFRIEERDDVLSVRASADNFALKKHSLLQAILAVNDLFYLSSATVLSLFKEDVERWLALSEIRFVPNIQIVGKTGYIHNFDFAIPSSRAAPERIIKAIGNPNKDAALAYVTSWVDTLDQRPANAQALAFLNDNGRVIGPPVLDALRQYDIKPVIWSEREEYRQQLAA